MEPMTLDPRVKQAAQLLADASTENDLPTVTNAFGEGKHFDPKSGDDWINAVTQIVGIFRLFGVLQKNDNVNTNTRTGDPVKDFS